MYMKSKSFRFNDEDEKKMSILKDILKMESDFDVIRYCMTSIISFGEYVKNISDPSDNRREVVAEVKKKIPTRKYSDEYIEAFIRKNDEGSFYDRCPLHPFIYAGQCECIKDKEGLKKNMQNIYESI